MSSSSYQESTAIGKLKQMFSGSEASELSPEQILMAVGKPPENAKSRQWLRDTLRSMSVHNFVDKITERTPTGANKIKVIKLTVTGLEALGRIQGPGNTSSAGKSLDQQPVNLEQVYRDIKLLREQLPSFNVVFEVTPKEQV